MSDPPEEFEQLCGDYCGAGYRATHYLTYFAGKDLLGAMRNDLIQTIGIEPGTLKARVLQAIERAPSPWEWLPEWGSLRAQVQAFVR